ncbi:hypothetical protein A2974_01780 [Candidatus Peregrinibacteria bacterium RIFCSPLOWO2_01_FULL_48_20]|nr:MAG: hypothetical protein A2974_01780 [Candidatus Peregrinibacteria bacterium RIFCSPLOWO2_01_FULL_48_20]
MKFCFLELKRFFEICEGQGAFTQKNRSNEKFHFVHAVRFQKGGKDFTPTLHQNGNHFFFVQTFKKTLDFLIF